MATPVGLLDSALQVIEQFRRDVCLSASASCIHTFAAFASRDDVKHGETLICSR
jgi:hypothetical protein